MAIKTNPTAPQWQKHALIVILLLAAVLRLWGLGRGDVLGDEGSYAFRGLGMLDFDEASLQTTPLEWFDPASPWWLSLSFHDHPPLVFFIQHIFMGIFGETNIGFRLPSALLGIASVYLLYKIGETLYGKRPGFLAASILAVSVNHVYISRLGLQESYVIFFILLTAYFFLRSFHEASVPHTPQNPDAILLAGISLGLAVLTKYTALAIAPILASYLLLTNPRQFLNKKLWLAILLAIFVASPVIVYNLMLYKTRGHFDFQLSYIFHQYPEVWKITPGKEIGTIPDRIRGFPANLIASNSWLMISLWAISLLAFLWALAIATWQKIPYRAIITKHLFLLLSFLFLLALILFIGPAPRFLSYLAPYIALSVACLGIYAYDRLYTHWQKLGIAIFLVICVFEVFYTYNSAIRWYPVGQKTWAYASIRYENYNWGYNTLDAYLAKELEGKIPAFTFQSKYQFIDRIQTTAIARDKKLGYKGYAALIVYDKNIFNTSQLWIIDRLQIYHGWPVLSADAYQAALRDNGTDYFEKIGIKTTYFIKPLDSILLKSPELRSLVGATLEQELKTQNVVPVSLPNAKDEEAFRVYKF